MLRVPNATFLTKFAPKPCGAGLHHHFSPARVCSGDSLRLSGPWVSSSHPASDNFHHFSSEFIDISPIRRFLRRCAPIWSPPPTIIHLGDFFRHMAQCHRLSTMCSPNNSVFSSIFIDFSMFRACAHPIWSPTTIPSV